MRPKLKILLACLVVCLVSSVTFSQSFTFNCTRDTVIARCSPTACFTLTSQIPDIRAQSVSYTVNPIGTTPAGCFPVYVQPNDPGGTSANLNLDDIYSNVINIGFPFPFYGVTYNQAISSPNGMLSFIIANAGQFAHYGILRDGLMLSATAGVPLDLPSSLYDPAIIMGPYHDINPLEATSPNRKVQYQVIGTAPHRKWVLSYFEMPLYSVSGGCNLLIQNTHQIVLFESTGIIEVLVFDKQPCVGWNDGRGMIGIQDATKIQGLMVQGRRASDPPWGAPGMREAYRFVPATGASLLKRVELCDLAGTILQTGTTTSLGNGKLEASFPNICPAIGSTVPYVVRSVYSKFDDPAVEIIGTDTVIVTKNSATTLNATFTLTNTSCFNPTGSITVTIPPGTASPPFNYVLDGGAPVTGASPYTFLNLGQGPHTITVEDQSSVCTDVINFTILRNNDLTANTSTTPASCASVPDGSITIAPTNGTGPFNYAIDGSLAQSGGSPFTFSNLNAGNHTILITDATGCQSNVMVVDVPIGPGVTGSTSSTPVSCAAASNGTITVTAVLGVAPFRFQLDGGGIQPGSSPFTFNNVGAGTHTVTIIDDLGCTTTINVTVDTGPGITGTTSSAPATCPGIDNGSITVTAVTGVAPFLYQLDGFAFVPGTSPHTFTNVSAGFHTVTILDNAGCLQTFNLTVNSGPPLNANTGTTPTSCNGGMDGTITVTPTNGSAPYSFSLDGALFVAGASPYTFSNVNAGNHFVVVRDVFGCITNNLSVTVSEPPPVTASFVITPVRCNGESNGLIQITPGGGVNPYQYSIDGGINWQGSNQFTVAAGNYTITTRDANGCSNNSDVTVVEPAVLTAVSVNSNATCDGGNDGRINVNASGGNGSYVYSLNGVTFQGSNSFLVGPGNYTIYVKDILGCITSFTTTVGLTFNLTLAPQADVTICEGSSIVLRAVSNANLYNWSPAAGLSNTTIYNPVASPVTTTDYIVDATLGRCTLKDTIRVNVNEAPIADAGPDGDICYGQSYTLQGSGGVEYTWSPPIYLDAPTVANPVSTPTRTTSYILSVRDAMGCYSLITDEATVVVSKPMRIHTTPFDTIAYPGSRIPLRANSDSGIIYSWSPSLGLSNPNIPDPIATVGNIGEDLTYQVLVTSAAGCIGEGYVRIRIYKGPDIYVPTAFTPNGDGKNDRLTPFPVGINELKAFRVFNRWGNLVFSTRRLHDGWDGKLQGREQPAGTYVWVVEAVTKDGNLIEKKGTVTLIR